MSTHSFWYLVTAQKLYLAETWCLDSIYTPFFIVDQSVCSFLIRAVVNVKFRAALAAVKRKKITELKVWNFVERPLGFRLILKFSLFKNLKNNKNWFFFKWIFKQERNKRIFRKDSQFYLYKNDFLSPIPLFIWN